MMLPVTLEAYVLDTLMRDLVGHDRRPSAYLVYLALCAEHAAGRAALSHGEMAERTGLSKRAVQEALRHLAGRSLIAVERRGPTEAAIVTPLSPWRRGAPSEVRSAR
jgi:DNA-binding GntR family transcriptional regulator